MISLNPQASSPTKRSSASSIYKESNVAMPKLTVSKPISAGSQRSSSQSKHSVATGSTIPATPRSPLAPAPIVLDEKSG